MPSAASRPVSGFTLVELSIVLVIIGLLLGGVLIGKDMIRSAQFRSVVTDAQNYIVASQMFIDKYNCVPGDCANITTFLSGVTNGDGNGQLGNSAAANGPGEMWAAWQHLAKAGYIKGAFSGNAGPASNLDAVIGTNVPASKLPGGGFTWQNDGYHSGSANYFDGNSGNFFFFGAKANGNVTYANILTPAEAYSIDIKIDDGVPATGSITTYWSGTYIPNCATGANNSGSASSYNLSYTSVSCVLAFLSGW